MGDKPAEAASQPAVAQQTQTPGEATPPVLPDLSDAQLLEILDRRSTDGEFRKVLRGRPVIGGIAGELSQRQREQEQEASRRQGQQAEFDRLKDLRLKDPLNFAEEMGVLFDKSESEQQLSGLRSTFREQAVIEIMEACKDLPEFEELTPAQSKAVTKAVLDMADDQKPIAGLFRSALGMVLGKRVPKEVEAAVKNAVDEERKAAKKEREVARLQGRQAPTLAKPGAGNAQDNPEPDYHDHVAWRKWDQENEKAGRGVYAAARR